MLIIFILFVEKDATGYVITERLKSRIGLLFPVSAGAVYPQLNKLEEDGLIHSEMKNLDNAFVRPNEPRKVYNLTNYGITIMSEVEKLWDELTEFMHMFLDDIKVVKEEG